jgi:predicted small metal-binding protein
MKKLACRDLGTTCEWLIYADNEEDIVRKTKEHTATAHQAAPDDKKVRKAIKTT